MLAVSEEDGDEDGEPLSDGLPLGVPEGDDEDDGEEPVVGSLGMIDGPGTVGVGRPGVALSVEGRRAGGAAERGETPRGTAVVPVG